MFKGMFTHFKNIKSVDFHIRCDPTKITFFTRGNEKKNKVVATIEGKNLNRYYCEETFWVGGRQDKFYQVFSKATKAYSKVTIICKHDNDSIMTIIFKDEELSRERNYDIKLKKLESDDDLISAEKKFSKEVLRTYPINFVLPSKQFRCSITDANCISNVITIEKSGKEPLRITTPDGNDIVYQEVYRKDEKIKLQSDVDESNTFKCKFNGENIKFVATSLVTGDVKIFVSEVNDLIICLIIDKLIIYTFVPIIQADARHIQIPSFDNNEDDSQ